MRETKFKIYKLVDNIVDMDTSAMLPVDKKRLGTGGNMPTTDRSLIPIKYVNLVGIGYTYKQIPFCDALRDGLVMLDGSGELLQSNNVVVVQYTGHRDENGVGIYEGDIVGSHHYEMDDYIETVYLVSTIESFANGLMRGHIDAKRSKVIGNTYENPDLIPEKNFGSNGCLRNNE